MLLQFMSKSVLSIFSSRSFIVSGLLFRSLIHFEGFCFVLFCLFRAAPTAYGGSQARGSNKSYSCQPTPQPQQCEIQAETATYTTAHSNARSLTHSARPGIKPASSGILVGFKYFRCATTRTPSNLISPVFFFSCNY